MTKLTLFQLYAPDVIEVNEVETKAKILMHPIYLMVGDRAGRAHTQCHFFYNDNFDQPKR